MVKDAEDKKAPMQRITDKWASVLVPVALVIAIITYIITKDITRAVTILVVFCPCALVLATPTAIMAAIGQATKHGIIIKSGEALEKLNSVDKIAFDKTGTLTYGRLEVSDVISVDEKLSDDELLMVTASAEAFSEHPLGKAITAYARKNGVELKEITGFAMEAGKGISGNLSDMKILCGNEKYMSEKGIDIASSVKEKLEALRSEGKALVITAVNGKISGIIALSDVLRENSSQMTAELSKIGVGTVLLTGDNLRTARYFADRAGISEVYAQLLPEEKVSGIVNLQKNGSKVCMIGDGVNDAPALKTADVGVAMGTVGSDIAVEAADIALMNDDVSNIPYLKKLSRATVNTIRFSITLSLLINFAAIVLSVLELLNPTTGALVHNVGSVFVVLIAALLYDKKIK